MQFVYIYTTWLVRREQRSVPNLTQVLATDGNIALFMVQFYT